MNAYIVDKAALEHNLAVLQKKAGETIIWGVVKGDGYGLGCTKLASILASHGINYFAVTRIEEAERLRLSGLETAEILMMDCTCDRSQIQRLLNLKVVLTVGTEEDAKQINICAHERGIKADVHVKIDTGMGRYGFLPSELDKILDVYRKYPNLNVVGIYTHFNDSSVEAPTRKQFEVFQSVLEQLRNQDVEVGMVHCCNSSAFWKYPDMHCDAVRIGSGLLGRLTIGQTGLAKLGYCRSQVQEVRWIPKGHTVGYGAGFVAKQPTRIAVVPVGYINGFAVDRGYDLWRPVDCIRGILRYLKALIKKRSLYVEVNGKNCRVLGHVGMVNMVVDVTDVPCKPGDPVRVEINPLTLKNMDVVFETHG